LAEHHANHEPVSVRITAITAVVRVVLIAVLAVVVVSMVLRVFDFRQAPDYGEGTVLAVVERMQREPASRTWVEGPEYTLSPYGPVYYWAVRGATAVLPWQNSLLPGRLVSLLATLTTAVLVAMLVYRQSGSVDLAILSAILLLLSPVVHTWATPHRVDPLAVLLALTAYMAVGVRRGGVFLSACLVVLASLVKQNMALAAVAVMVYLLAQRRWKGAVAYAVLVAGLGGLGWLALDQASGGYYLATAVRGHLGAMWPQQGFVNLYWFLATPLGLAASIVVAWLLVQRPAEAFGSIYTIAFAASVLAAAALSCKEGASYAYFFEASVLAAVVVGRHGLGMFLAAHRQRALLAAGLTALLLVAPELRALRHRGTHLDTKPYQGQPIAASLSFTSAAKRPCWILADGQYLEAALQAGHRPLINDPFLFRQLVGNGTLAPTKVTEALARGDVRALVLKRTIERHRKQVGSISQKWPVEILDAMERFYVLEASVGDDLFIYRWRGP